MDSREESRGSRIIITVLLIAFAVVAGCIAAYYYTFHGYKKQRPAVAPAASVIVLNAPR